MLDNSTLLHVMAAIWSTLCTFEARQKLIFMYENMVAHSIFLNLSTKN